MFSWSSCLSMQGIDGVDDGISLGEIFFVRFSIRGAAFPGSKLKLGLQLIRMLWRVHLH